MENIRIVLSFIIGMYIAVLIWRDHARTSNNDGWVHIPFDKIKEGDTIRVNVGFNHFKQEGIVSRKVVDDEYPYLWADKITESGKIYHSFTASASYGHFEKLCSKSQHYI